MGPKRDAEFISRRKFVQVLGMLTVGGRTFLNSGDARAAIYAARDAAAGPTAWPSMTYRTLGRTNFEASRLVMGCGASLMFRKKDLLLNTAYDAGINVFDVGYSGYYRYAEENLSGFLKKVRDKIFLISKAPAELDVEPNDIVTVQQARETAKLWSRRLDESLVELGRARQVIRQMDHDPASAVVLVLRRKTRDPRAGCRDDVGGRQAGDDPVAELAAIRGIHEAQLGVARVHLCR